MSKLAFAAIVLAAAIPAVAQQGRGSYFGTVTDTTGAAVPGAKVTLTNVATNTSVATETNNDGIYTATALQIGEYTIQVEKSGFKRAVRSGLTLQVDQRGQIDFRLDVGGVAETIEVKGEAPLVDTGSATVGKVVENRRVMELPLNGRNALALTLLTPSVKSNAGPTNSGFGDRGIQLSSISINGGPNAMNAQSLDGSNNIQSYIGEVAINPAVDAVEEFKVQSGTMSAEYGFTGGGVINVVSKSGTNQLHGSVYEFLRNNKLDARNTFSTVNPPFRYNQYGVAVGGPVIKDKTFFFGNWEQYDFRRTNTFIGTMPTVRQRGGDFGDLLGTNGALIPIYDPATTSGLTRSVFPNNRIPVSRMDPIFTRCPTAPQPTRSPTPITSATTPARSAACGSIRRRSITVSATRTRCSGATPTSCTRPTTAATSIRIRSFPSAMTRWRTRTSLFPTRTAFRPPC
jgi:hypothetical protein